MKIRGREIGPGHPVYVIAELGVNHDGSVSRGLELVQGAAGAGADAIKLQLFRADLLMSRASRLAEYQAGAGESDPHAMLRRLELSAEGMRVLVEAAHARGMAAIVTVFSVALVEEAEALGVDAYKSASPDIVHRPLLEAMGATGKPLIVSTGASTAEEVVRARGWLGAVGAEERLAMLQCVSSYPTRDEDAALGGIDALVGMGLGCPIGYSDHTMRTETGLWAAVRGATVLEKHLTHDRGAPGPDHAASLDADQFREYIAAARSGRSASAPPPMVGPIEKRVAPCEEDVRTLSRQSIVATRAIREGEALSAGMLTCKRPGTGIPPYRMGEVLGRVTIRSIAADMPVTEEDLR